jgi:hypothetical protein
MNGNGDIGYFAQAPGETCIIEGDWGRFLVVHFTSP